MTDISFSSQLRAVVTPPDMQKKNLIDLGSYNPAAEEKGGGGKSFGDFVQDFVADVNKGSKLSDKMATDLATGKNKNIHETMIQMQKADLNFRMMVQVRNKVLEAYQEVMRMQV